MGKDWSIRAMHEIKKGNKFGERCDLLSNELLRWKIQVKSSLKNAWTDNLQKNKQNSKGYGIW